MRETNYTLRKSFSVVGLYGRGVRARVYNIALVTVWRKLATRTVNNRAQKKIIVEIRTHFEDL